MILHEVDRLYDIIVQVERKADMLDAINRLIAPVALPNETVYETVERLLALTQSTPDAN